MSSDQRGHVFFFTTTIFLTSIFLTYDHLTTCDLYSLQNHVPDLSWLNKIIFSIKQPLECIEASLFTAVPY